MRIFDQYIIYCSFQTFILNLIRFAGLIFPFNECKYFGPFHVKFNENNPYSNYHFDIVI